VIYSSRHILHMRQQLLSITPEQWLLLSMGLIVGCVVWVFFNRKIVHRFAACLKGRTFRVNTIAAVEGLIGGAVFLANGYLVYVATLISSFFLFSFAVVGLLVGAWITMPPSFE